MENKEQRPKGWVDQAKSLNHDVEIRGSGWSSKLFSLVCWTCLQDQAPSSSKPLNVVFWVKVEVTVLFYQHISTDESSSSNLCTEQMNSCLKAITEVSKKENYNSSNNNNNELFYSKQNIAIRYFRSVNQWGEMFNENIQLLFWA